jgi:dTDP-D-glucose 4,6-dehydratase
MWPTTAAPSAPCWPKAAPGEVYNVGGWNEKTNLEIVHTVCALLDELRPSPRAPTSG